MNPTTKWENQKIKNKKWVGVIVVLCILVVIILILVIFGKPFSPNTKGFDKSIIIQQRIINLEKSRK